LFTTRFSLRLAAGLLYVSAAGAFGQLPFDFVIQPAQSGFSATLGVAANTTGTLIGNYDPKSNPTGTRTKPGLFGPFGPDENLPVNMTLGLGLGGSPQSQQTGAFRLTLNPAAGTVTLAGYQTDLLASGPLGLDATLSLETETFRTRNPTSVYIGGVPIELPIGEATLSELTAAQTADPAVGVLQTLEPNRYAFLVAPLVTLTATLDVFGNPIEFPGAPTPFLLEGEIVVSGDSAVLTALRAVTQEQTLEPGLALPEFPLDLPTILPPGDTAHLLLNLTLSDVTFGIDGELRTTAFGTLVPEPGTAVLLLAAVVVLSVRRR